MGISSALIAFGCTAVLACITSPLVISLYSRFGWVDDPSTNTHSKRTHTRTVPRGGGLIVFLSITLVALVYLKVDAYLLAILSGGLVLMIMGVLDDIFDVHPMWRLLAGGLAATIVVGSGIGIAYVSNPLGTGVIHLNQPQLTLNILGETRTIWLLADIFAVLFIVWNMNIVNWSKGVDGQLPGFVSIAAVFVGLLSLQFIDDPTQFNTAHLSFIVAGAFAGYAYWNWFPQRSMPGYGGGSLAGYFLAVLAILSGAKVATTLMVLALPTADALVTIARRLHSGKSPIWGDRGHLHHILFDVAGWGRRRIALFYWSTSFGLGMVSLYVSTHLKLLILAVVFAAVLYTHWWARRA